MSVNDKTIIKYIPDFLEYCEVEKGLSPVTARNYDNFLKVFKRWLISNGLEAIKPQNLTSKHIWDYRLYLSRKREKNGSYVKKTTQNYYLIAIRSLLAYFAEKDIGSLPSDKVKLPKLTDKDKKIKFLNYEQVEKLLSVPDITKKEGLRDRALLEVLFSTGMRVSELTSLNMRTFDMQKIISGKQKDLELAISGKGGSSRTVYFSSRSLKWLGLYLKTRADLYSPLFINYHRAHSDEHRLTPRSVARLVSRYAAMAGLPVAATPHTLRHSFATDLLEQGADMRSVQELLGHKNIVTTQVYTHVTNKKLRDTHRQFHQGNK